MKSNYSLAIQAAVNAGKAILEIYGEADFGIEYKTDSSPLTIADTKANELIGEMLKETEIPIFSGM